jgi:cyclomaltodextrinase / maltogenic alpha-amylase / neopullulanase
MERRRIVGLLLPFIIATSFWWQPALAADASTSQTAATFVYRPKDDPAVGTNMEVHSVNLAGSFNDWSRTAAPMTDDGSGTYVAHLKLDKGIYHYKFVVNGDTWMPDPKADPALREDDGHEGFNSGVFVGEQGKDFGPVVPNQPNMAAVRHDPSQASYFNVVAADTVEVRLRTLHDDVQRVVLHWRDHGRREIPMQRGDTSYGFDYWSASVPIEGSDKTASYYFALTDGAGTVNYGASNRAHAVNQWFNADLTQRFPTPDWARNVVWYQIFPERFRNGTTDNDPPHTLPWRWDWYKMAPGEEAREGGKFSNNWYGRRFGGDFQGVMSELPYFRELGVTALYFCPIFEASSNHGYDTVDYRHVSQYFGFKGDYESVAGQETLDPKTWKWTPTDRLFLQFVKAAHAQGLKVIIDGVFNHMGRNSFALQDVLTNGVNSPYADWFDITSWGPPVKYHSWDGGGSMPNFHKDSQKGYASDSAKKYIFDITRRWMDPDGNPADGVDGWRLDVAQDVPAPFWIDWRKEVKGINSNAYITGEIWGIATKYLQGNEWDAVMNYQFGMRAIHYFIDQRRKISATEFDHQLKQLLASYPMQVNYVMQNLYDSHDTDRLVSMIANPDRDYNQGNRAQDGAHYDGAKPGPSAYQIQKLMATFQMTFLGAPMIWYGDEAGMFGGGDPTNRKPMLWRDLEPYDNPQDTVMQDVFEHYRRVIAIRNTYPALRTGQIHTWVADDANDLYGFTRTRGDEVVAVVVNNSDRDQVMNLPSPFPDGSRVVDVMNAAPVKFDMVPMESLGFPNFAKDAMVRAIRVGPNTRPVYEVHNGKIGIGVARKSAAILVRE